MMKAHLFDEGARLPAFHAGRGDGNPINRATLDRDITAHCLETLAAEDLAGARDMAEVRAAVGVGVHVRSIPIFDKRGSRDPQARNIREAVEQKFEVVRFDRNVGIQIADQVELHVLEPFVACIEGVGLGSKLAITMLGHTQEFDPVVFSSV